MALKLEYADDDIEIESQGVKIALYVNAWNGEIKNVDKGVIITFNSYVSSITFSILLLNYSNNSLDNSFKFFLVSLCDIVFMLWKLK